MQRCVTIHGHFYQPPRENPWTESIDQQDSAFPYHDWNERINHECYTPNAYARVLEAANRITNIVNNFEQISFNFGPTLISWLEKFAPQTYRRIIEADRKSVQRFGGHGNAIAQAYNHPIIPLCNEQDKVTQVLWGLADFRHRFGREPEATWLPETAVNDATMRVLIDHGMKYVILSPHQAKKIRRLDGNEWTGVEHGEIDSTRPYRWYERDNRGRIRTTRYIEIFFYHLELARGVGFEHIVRDANNFANRIAAAVGSDGADVNHLVSVATDGESYGHHDRHGERGLAYLLNIEVPRRNITITNYGQFLEKNPPKWEVQLKDGENNEGTAWSCAHGLGRWRRNCGCRGGGPAEWHQNWRAPLRHALDELRDELNHLTIELGEPLFKDPFEARNGYIDVILDRSPARIHAFFAGHQRRPLNEEEKLAAIKLMEMQRNAQLMYTSCGWFFTELSGIETVQVIQYAARAIQLAEALSHRPFEGRFIRNLKLAPSNMPEYGDGEGIYLKLVKPAVVSFIRVVNTYAIRSLYVEVPEVERLYHYSLQREDVAVARTENLTLMTGLVRVLSGVTDESHRYAYALIKRKSITESAQCYVRLANEAWAYPQHRDQLITAAAEREDVLIEKLQKHWGGKAFGLQNMFFEERQQVIKLMLQGRLDEIGAGYSMIYEDNLSLIFSLRDLGARLPQELSAPAHYTLSQQLRQEIENLNEDTEIDSYRKCLDLTRIAAKLGIELDTQWPSQHLQGMIERRLNRLLDLFEEGVCKEILNLIEISQRLRLVLNFDPIQNLIFAIIQERLLALIDLVLAHPENTADYNLTSNFLQIAYYFGFNTKIYKDRLKLVEQQFSDDPRFWP